MGLLDGLFGGTTRVGLLVDGPNVLRSEFGVDLQDVRAVAAEAGTIAVSRLYLDQNASAGLIQAGEATGFEVVTTSGDVDTKLAVDGTELAVLEVVDLLAIASRDTDFKPVLEVASKHGLETMAIAPGTHGRSDALQNSAQTAVTLGE
jgi:uncharacterized protein (TIGR00288 family)